MKEAKVKDLHVTEGAFFLPLNGPTTVMNGSITAAKVRVTGLVGISTGRITGKGFEPLKPLKEIFTPITLNGDRFLQNVTFRNFVKAKDIVRSHGLSVKEILENSVPLDSNVSAHLILSSDKTVIILKFISMYICDDFKFILHFYIFQQWSNVTLWDFVTTMWITKNSSETIVISGTKYTNNSVVLSDAVYESLPIPKYILLCLMKHIARSKFSKNVYLQIDGSPMC